MTLPVWPVLAEARMGTWTLTPKPDVRMTDYDVGPKTGRRRIEMLAHEVTFQQVMTADDYQAFTEFYEATLHHGADKFTIPVWDGEDYSTVIARFVGAYTAQQIGLELMQVSIRLLVMNLPVISDGAVWFVTEYGFEFADELTNLLHPLIHVDYPACFPTPPFDIGSI